MNTPVKPTVLANLGKKLALEHANNYKKTGFSHSELKTLAQQILARTQFLRESSKKVFLYLNGNAARFNPTLAEIVRVTGLSRRTVTLALRELEKTALIQKQAFRRKTGRNQTEYAKKYHLNHLSAWRLGDALSISAIQYPKVNICSMVTHEHGVLGLMAPCDFVHFNALSQKKRRGPKTKLEKELIMKANSTEGILIPPNTEQPNETSDNLNTKIPEYAKEEQKTEKVNLGDATRFMKVVLCKTGVFPGIDLNKIESSYQDVVVQMRDQILRGLKTENPVLDLVAIFMAAADCQMVRAQIRTPNGKRMRTADYWLGYFRRGSAASAQASLMKQAAEGTLKFRRYGS